MDGGSLAVVDISSDDEVGFNDTADDNFGWVEKLLLEEDDEGAGETRGVNDDLDDVVVIREVLANKKERNKTSNLAKFGIEEDDDDCIMLDGDPDKPVAEVKDSGDGSDDLLIVGEKGPVACRDFPHSRHLCVKFPFSSAPRESHCDLCHCYVCDSVAPCAFWGSGASDTDHCNATDKDEFWKSERKRVRRNAAPSLGHNLPAASLLPNLVPQLAPLIQNPATDGVEFWKNEPGRVLQGITAPSPGSNMSAASLSLPNPAPQLAPLIQNPTPYNQVPELAPNGSVSFELPNIISHARLPRPDFDPSRSSCQLQQERHHDYHTDSCWREVGPRVESSQSMFKRPGPPVESSQSVLKRLKLTRRVVGANQSNYIPVNGSNLSNSRQLASCHEVATAVETYPGSFLESQFHGAPNWGVQHAPHQMDVSQIPAATVSSQLQGFGRPTVLPSASSPCVYASGVQVQGQASSNPTSPYYGSGLPSDSTQISQPSLIDNSQLQNAAVLSIQGSVDGCSSVRPSGAGGSTTVLELGFGRWLQNNQPYPGIGPPEVMSPVRSTAADPNAGLLDDSWLFQKESGPGIQGGSLHTDIDLSSSIPSPPVDAAALPYVEFDTTWEGLAWL